MKEASMVSDQEIAMAKRGGEPAPAVRPQRLHHLKRLRSAAGSQAQPPPKNHFNLQHHPQFPSHQQFPPHFALQHHCQLPFHELNFRHPHSPLTAKPPPQLQQHQQLLPQPVVTKANVSTQNAAPFATTEVPKESALVAPKRRCESGGLNKVCSVSPELQAIVGERALPRTEIVKQLWAYIWKNSLQDPSNKRKIICDEALRVVFETDCTDMFKMNELLAKHISPLDPSKESSQTKKGKVNVESTTEGVEPGPNPVIISEALTKFLGAGGRERLAAEAERRVWEYTKVNHLEDPSNSMVVLCDANLRELIGCESISVMGIRDSLLCHHLFKQS
ncbi:uncharacterized protein LOC120151249 [Hibiscus syriacus]|uniref:uncharacterized protein LOC120151249 n=1 Tax=Hibiscus syriacus TaxID=106335 RepID=UPI0019203CDD|nr:uncharacterized protein LOC120151249 [Hibiscus syriacus]